MTHTSSTKPHVGPESNTVALSLAARTSPESTRTDRAWTIAQIESSARTRGTNAEGRLLAVFEVLDDLFNRADREARKFVVVLAGLSQGRPLDRTGAEILASFRALIDTFAAEASLQDPQGFALSWRIIMNGAIIKAVEGDLDSALRAKEMARDLISRHRAVTERPIMQKGGHATDTPVSYDLDTEWLSSLDDHSPQNGVATFAGTHQPQGTNSALVQPLTGEIEHGDARGYSAILTDLEWDLG